MLVVLKPLGGENELYGWELPNNGPDTHISEEVARKIRMVNE